MNQILELLGANVIGGLIMLLGISINMQINTASRDILEDTIQLRNAMTSFQVVEYDLQKIGYNVTGEKIIVADSNAIKFKSDLYNNGSVKTVNYSVSDASAMSSTKNPNDRLFYRKIDANDPRVVSVITRINFVYYDSIGQKISYSSLSNAANRALIRSIQTYVKSEGTDQINGIYKPVEWKTVIRPSNIIM